MDQYDDVDKWLETFEDYFEGDVVDAFEETYLTYTLQGTEPDFSLMKETIEEAGYDLGEY